MNGPSHPPHAHPAQLEARAREARLDAVLAAMEAAGPSREPALLRSFRAAVAAGRAEEASALLPALVEEGLAEEAWTLLREARRTDRSGGDLQPLGQRLAALAAEARARRAAGWQLDARRAAFRFCYGKRGDVLGFDSGDLQRILLAAFRLEGFLVALDLGHHPRPLLQMGPPLPAGVAGGQEWAEVVLRRAPGAPDGVIAALHRRLPAGLRILRWEDQPAWATPVSELALASVWEWPCPTDRLEESRAAVQRFLDAETFSWQRPGKVEGQKQGKQVDLRPLVSSMAWDGAMLRFETPMGVFGATNPLKMLAAVLGREPESLEGLARTSLRLAEDPRVAQADRFEPKLRNLYEDAVLLSGGSNITIVDEDDDEPIRLG